MKTLKAIVLFSACALVSVQAVAKKKIPLVYDQEFTGSKYAAPAFPTVDEAKPSATLPNPFEFSNSTKQVKKFKDWEKRRAEIVRELQHYEIGEKPMIDKKDIEATIEDGLLTVKVTRNGETLEISAKITYPEGDGPFPLMIGASNNALPRQFFTEKKIATVNFSERQVNSYSQMAGMMGGGGQRKDRGDYDFDRLYPELKDNGAYSEWAWGVSRLIDGLEIVGAASKIDLKHIGITGCSYAGKMALWSGAMDERIALTIAGRKIMCRSFLMTTTNSALWFVLVPFWCLAILIMSGWPMKPVTSVAWLPVRCGRSSALRTVWDSPLRASTVTASSRRASILRWKLSLTGSCWARMLTPTTSCT